MKTPRQRRQNPQLQILESEPPDPKDTPLSPAAIRILKKIWKHYGREYGRTMH